VEVGDRDHIAVFWSRGDQRRAVIGLPWPGPRTVLERILSRFPGGTGHALSVSQQLAALSSPGSPIIVRLARGDQLGLVTPYVSGAVDGSEPVLLTLGRNLAHPVLFGDVGRARDFARRQQTRHGGPLPWRLFLGEHSGAPDAFAPRLSAAGAVARTRLEEEISAGPRRHRRPKAA
jgi:hypothetical protein